VNKIYQLSRITVDRQINEKAQTNVPHVTLSQHGGGVTVANRVIMTITTTIYNYYG